MKFLLKKKYNFLSDDYNFLLCNLFISIPITTFVTIAEIFNIEDFISLIVLYFLIAGNIYLFLIALHKLIDFYREKPPYSITEIK